MKRILCLLLCVLMLCGLLILPVTAAIFHVTYYSEAIYAGGVVDLYAYPKNGGVEPFTYQWQAEGFGWIDLKDNDVYQGTNTNHMRLYTQTGSYSDFGSIPFQCAVTDAEGDTFYTPDIYMTIYPTDDLIPDMKSWGYGLHTPTLTNVSGLKGSGDAEYTASAYAGSKIDISCGNKSVEDKDILVNSEVKLIQEIHITENAHTTKTGDKTTYVPYTVGTNAVTVDIKLRLSIGGHDLGDFDSKTIKISTSKPTATSTATTNTACSLLRYTYNESQKLASIPKGTSVEVLRKEDSYYQVFYNNYVGYIGTSLLNVQTPSYDPVIKVVDVTIPAPVAGEKPSFTCSILTEGCQLYKTEPMTWYDTTAKKFLSSTDKFQEDHTYDLAIWLAAKSGYKFQVDASYKPKLKGSINGDLPPFIHKAYEQDPEEVIELTYTFNNVKAKEPEQTHTCTPVLVERVEPTCTEKGHEAYYRCSYGMHYKDSQGQTAVNTSTWGSIPATGHTPSSWRTTQVYHYKVCTSCGDMLEQEDHKGGTATCVEKAKCAECGYAYGREEPDHRWGPGWDYKDDTGHVWVCADCKDHSDIKPHTPGPEATETKPQTCKDCGYIIEPAKNHTHTLTQTAAKEATCLTEGNLAYYTCSGCEEWFTDAAGKKPVADKDGILLPALGRFTDQWQFDGESHWQSCTVCEAVIDAVTGFHGDEDADGQCDICGYTFGSEAPAPPVKEEPAATPAAEPTDAPAEASPATAPAEYEEASPASTNWLLPVLVALFCFAAATTATVIILKQKKKEKQP